MQNQHVNPLSRGTMGGLVKVSFVKMIVSKGPGTVVLISFAMKTFHSLFSNTFFFPFPFK